MGIKDLLRFMKPYTEPIHIQKYTDKRIGIDAYSWLHKGAYSCSMELSSNTEGDKKLQYINYFMHRINLLRHHKITPVVVFDGGNIPCKAATENDRYRRRKENKDMAMEKLKQGNVNGAVEHFQRAINITPSMAHLLIQTLKSEKIEFIVAPYEADAQLAYLSSLGEEEGGVVAVISEDSDLLAYGCPSIIFKMDKFGNGQEIILDKVFNATNTKPSFRNFNTNLFIDMCVLAGCDFLPSIPGIGISKAHALVSKYRNMDRVLTVLKNDKGKQVPEDYERSFREAVAVFQHATIYNKRKKGLEHLNEIPESLLKSLGEVDFLGPHIPPAIANSIAEGNLDPSTLEAYECSPSQQLSTSAQTSEQHKVSPPAYAVESVQASQQARKGYIAGAAEDMIQNFKVKNYRLPELPEPDQQVQSCFTVISSRNTSTTMVKRQVLKERNILDEALTLSKLVTSSEIHKAETVSAELPVKTPDNNPFRKRKLQSENTETTPTTKSSVTEDDQSKLRNEILNLQESVTSKTQKLDKIAEQGKDKRKRKISNCKFSGNIKSSILNFFGRI